MPYDRSGSNRNRRGKNLFKISKHEFLLNSVRKFNSYLAIEFVCIIQSSRLITIYNEKHKKRKKAVGKNTVKFEDKEGGIYSNQYAFKGRPNRYIGYVQVCYLSVDLRWQGELSVRFEFYM
jgi:hypothetical protein